MTSRIDGQNRAQVPIAQDTGKVTRSVADFEAVLLNAVLAPLQHSFTHLPGGQNQQSTEAYSGLAMQTLTSELARQGGIGLGKMAARSLQKLAGASPRGSTRRNETRGRAGSKP